MKWTSLAVAVALLFCVAGAGEGAAHAAIQSAMETIQPDRRAEPVLVLLEENPWGIALGANDPWFVLYDDGVVIYRKADGHRVARLSPDESAALVASLQPAALGSSAGSYSAVDATDQTQTSMLLRTDAGVILISVYGPFTPTGGAMRGPPQDDPRQPPKAFLDAYAWLTAFERADAVAWSPEAFEVRLRPYAHSRSEPVVWPSSWPGLSHPDTLQRRDGYSLFVPYAELDSARDLISTRREQTAVAIEGRRWAASLRLPFPKEDVWMDWMRPGLSD